MSFNWTTVRSSICHVKKACMILHDFCAQRHPNPIPYRGTMTVISGPSHNIEKFMQSAHIFMWFVAKLLQLFVGTVNSSARTKTGDRMQFLDLHEFLKTYPGSLVYSYKTSPDGPVASTVVHKRAILWQLCRFRSYNIAIEYSATICWRERS